MHPLKVIQMALALLVGSALIVVVVYINMLRKDNIILGENNKKLTESVQIQQAVIIQKDDEIAEIKTINANMTESINKQRESLEELRNRFTVNSKGESRDIGYLAREKPKLITNIINKATMNVNRCIELATGKLPEPGETNNECENLTNQ